MKLPEALVRERSSCHTRLTHMRIKHVEWLGMLKHRHMRIKHSPQAKAYQGLTIWYGLRIRLGLLKDPPKDPLSSHPKSSSDLLPSSSLLGSITLSYSVKISSLQRLSTGVSIIPSLSLVKRFKTLDSYLPYLPS